jgi:hypothetical protein
MSSARYIDGAGAVKYRKVSGAGTEANPHIPEFSSADVGDISDFASKTIDTVKLLDTITDLDNITVPDDLTQIDYSVSDGTLIALTKRLIDFGQRSVLECVELNNKVETSVGSINDSPATSDTANASVISLLKRLLSTDGDSGNIQFYRNFN